MSLFGFGSKKEYQRGMADAAKAAGTKFNEIDEALSNKKGDLRTGFNQYTDDIQSILDILESDEREKLFGLADDITIKEDLDYDQKRFLMSILYSLAEKMADLNNYQKKYLITMYKYLELQDVQVVDIFNVSEVDTKDESKILYMIVNEFLYLGFNDWSYLEEKDFVDFSESFNLNRRDKRDVIKAIQQTVSLMGRDALILPYESKDVPRQYWSEDNASRPILGDYVWPKRTERLEFVVDQIKEIFDDEYYEGWQLKLSKEIELDDLISDGTEINDATAMLISNLGIGLILSDSGLTVFNKNGETATLQFDSVQNIFQVDEIKKVIFLKKSDGDLSYIQFPSEIYIEPDTTTGIINLNKFYTLIHTFIKRGPFYVGDINQGILDAILAIRTDYGFVFESFAPNASFKEALRDAFSSTYSEGGGIIINTVESAQDNEFEDINTGAVRVIDHLPIWKEGVNVGTVLVRLRGNETTFENQSTVDTRRMVALADVTQIKTTFDSDNKPEYKAVMKDGSEDHIYQPFLSDEMKNPSEFARIIMESIRLMINYDK